MCYNRDTHVHLQSYNRMLFLQTQTSVTQHLSNNMLQQLPNQSVHHMDRLISATTRAHRQHVCANLHAACDHLAPSG